MPLRGRRPDRRMTERRSGLTKNNNVVATARTEENPRASVSLVPMLIAGLVLTTLGMIAALALT